MVIIEILSSDEIEWRYFLSAGIKENYVKKEIYIVHYPKGEDIKLSKGKICKISEKKPYEFLHDASTCNGSSGGPIFIKGINKVIGIHKEGYEKEKKAINFGDYIFPVLEKLKNDSEYYKFFRELSIKFDNTEKSGKGIEYYENGKIKYKGDFNNGNYHGKGIEYYENGIINYDGDFNNNNYQGKGRLYCENGKIAYFGDFLCGFVHGIGILYDDNGILWYYGNWVKGSPNGKGKVYDESGNLLYEGDFMEGIRHGKGKIVKMIPIF